VGRTLIAKGKTARIQYLQPNYQFLALGYKRDQSGFGNLSVLPTSDDQVVPRLVSSAQGQTQLPGVVNQPRVGGYFSPQQFYLNNFRLDAGGRLFGHTFYDAGAGLGIQNFKAIGNRLADSGLVGTANASLVTRLNRRVTVEQGFYFLQAVTSYRRYVLYNQVKYYF
jgi:hypothetical protein